MGYELICLLTPIVLYVFSSFRLVEEERRLVVYRLGKLERVSGPGPTLIWRFIETSKEVDLRAKSGALPVIQVHNESLLASGRFTYRVSDPLKALANAADEKEATSSALRQVVLDTLANCSVREALTDKRKLEHLIILRARKRTADWGVEVLDVTLTDVPLPRLLVRTIANLVDGLTLGVLPQALASSGEPAVVRRSGKPAVVASSGGPEVVASCDEPDQILETSVDDPLSSAGQIDYKFGI